MAAFMSLGAAPQARATPALEAADATELAQALAEATAEQDVCYGWRVSVRDDSGGESGGDIGSSLGPDVALDRSRCERWVELVAAIHYTAETSDFDDSAEFEIESNLVPPPRKLDLQRLGVGDGSLTGEDNDVELINMIEALPLVVASNGQAPYVPFETSQTSTRGQGEPTGTPGSDVLRQWWPLVAICVLAILAGIVLLAGRLLGLLAARHATAAPDGPRAAPPDPKGR